MLVWRLRGSQRAFAGARRRPGFSPGVSPVKNQPAGPAGAAEGAAPPCEQRAALSGALGGEPRRNMDGGAPADDTARQYEASLQVESWTAPSLPIHIFFLLKQIIWAL